MAGRARIVSAAGRSIVAQFLLGPSQQLLYLFGNRFEFGDHFHGGTGLAISVAEFAIGALGEVCRLGGRDCIVACRSTFRLRIAGLWQGSRGYGRCNTICRFDTACAGQLLGGGPKQRRLVRGWLGRDPGLCQQKRKRREGMGSSRRPRQGGKSGS